MLIVKRYRGIILLAAFVLLFVFYLFKIQVYEIKTLIAQSRKCILSKKMPQMELKYVWPILPLILQECCGEVYNSFSVQKFNGIDESKYFIDPISNDSFTCNVITLGIGGETAAEEEMLKLYPQCNFFGIDSGAKNSEYLYKTRLNGTYIEGLVGAENGTYKASILDFGYGYVEKELPHFSFHYVTTNLYKKDIIDLLLIDIEGDEFALMKELIENPNKYPIICQINVEFHDPYNQKENVMDIFVQSTIHGPYLLIRTEYIYIYS